jgi:lactoylglutathione lyase
MLRQPKSEGGETMFRCLILIAGLLLGAQAQEAIRFDHVARHVKDLKTSAAFYENVVGLKPMKDPFNDGGHVWLRLGAQGELHLIAGAAQVPEQDMDVHMALRTPSMQNFIKKLDAAKTKWFSSKHEEGKITDRPDGIKQIYFQDPDGYWIEVNAPK